MTQETITLEEIKNEEQNEKEREAYNKRKGQKAAMTETYTELKKELELLLGSIEDTRKKIKQFEKNPEQYYKDNKELSTTLSFTSTGITTIQ